ncbi:hypothetical protein JNW91_16820 [Micromonospora sp. STR1_7]|uniref:Uncharacterized protein n=1 Tax=Micromonospora parastrephiae TaxID=2806101 RepID=A0ABS1XVS2_9ACTN|nr:hypothetical protein [Micromonospora parastrephiae]MBM0233372.1 hypothetical protein [Micromonospora parastrephiae]
MQSNPLLRVFLDSRQLSFGGANVSAVQAHDEAPHTFVGRCHQPGCRTTIEARVTRISGVMNTIRERIGVDASPTVTLRQFEVMLSWADLPAASLGKETLVAVALGRTVWKL